MQLKLNSVKVIRCQTTNSKHLKLLRQIPHTLSMCFSKACNFTKLFFRFQTNLAVIDNHLYTASGSYCYLAMWADEDAMALATFKQHISKFERLPICM
jgi:hypothetical protein